MGNELATTTGQVPAEVMEQVIAQGDLKALTAPQRVAYYRAVCDSLGLNWTTKPFEYITLNGKLTLYARKDATEQLRRAQGVSITRLERERLDGIYVVTATAQARDGRQDSSIGAVSIDGLKGDALANAMMKAETKAKRRVTLSICGLGWTDESEIESIPTARVAPVNVETGEIVQTVQSAPKPQAVDWTHVEGALDRIAEHYSLSYNTILEALGVKAIEDYLGSKADAKHAIEAWLSENVSEVVMDR